MLLLPLLLLGVSGDNWCHNPGASAWQDGTTDVLVVRREDGTLRSTAWNGQVGRGFSWWDNREGSEVTIQINRRNVQKRMIVCSSGSLQFPNTSPHSMNSQELESLQLNPGHNPARYLVPELGVSMEFSVFLVPWTEKLIVTDIDGTITREDVLGFLLPSVGITHHHEGVVELFGALHAKGYTIIYMTARSMALHLLTRDYLTNQMQDVRGHSMPPGPIFHLPRSLLGSVYSPGGSQMKAALLSSVWQCFSSPAQQDVRQTIIAGYGNNEGDLSAYRAAGLDRIYIVDTRSSLVDVSTGQATSYPAQARAVDLLYPTLT